METVAETISEPQSDVAVYESDISGEGITDISGGNAVTQDAEKTAEVKTVQANQLHDDEADHGIGDVPYWMCVDGLYQIKQPGYYCLTSDVELSSTYYLSAPNVVLCLNGHSITLNHDGEVISPGVNFTLCDCKGTGIITHGEDSDGNKYTGSGVSAYFGFRMTGGKITGNTAKNNGGGVCIHNVNENIGFIMTGGEITGNNTSQNGGGVYVDEGIDVKISGAAKITGNYANGTANNMYLPDGTTIKIADQLTGVKNIGVTLQTLPTEESDVIFAKADTGVTLTEDDAAAFFADASDKYGVTYNSGDNALSLGVKPHEHPVCGASCDHTGKDAHTDQVWTGISSLDDITADGSYYLTDSITRTSAWYCNYNVNLCLNGKTITGANDWQAIQANSGCSLTITDCQPEAGRITHASGTTGGGITVNGILTLWNGNIVNNRIAGSRGAGVYVYSTGTFNMNGGTISGNKADSGTGGGVFVGLSYGGSTDGTFNMAGGTIAGNTSTDGGGGVYMSSGTFNMTGGTITGNGSTQIHGAGVYLRAGATKMTVSGNVRITDNWWNGTLNQDTDRYVQGEDGKASNVYLTGTGDSLITITIKEGLNENSRIGIYKDNDDLLKEGDYVTVATGEVTGSSKNFFTDKGDPYSVKELNGELVLMNGDLHEHPICGETCTHKNADGTFAHESVRWTGVSDLAQITTAGHYFLKRDIDLTDTWTPADGVVLDLNGHTISRETKVNSLPEAIVVYTSNNFTMTDCTGNGKITHIDDSLGRGVRVHGSFTMYGGTITGNVDYTGAGVCVTSGTFRMLGGKIAGNSAANGESRGGGVYVNNSGEFLMEGGIITGNTAAGTGGGVYVNYDGTMTVSGDAKIENNWKDGTWNKDTGIYGQGTGSANNVALNNEKTITIGGTGLAVGAKIGVTTAFSPTIDIPIKIATGANDDNLRYSDIFTPDETGKNYTVVRTGTDLYLTKHQHNWKYELKSGTTDTIVAICDCGADGGSITLTPPEEKIYSGSYLHATVTPSDNWQGSDKATIDIHYGTENDPEIGGAPINAGTYVASISITGADNKTVTARLKFTINKAPLTVTAKSKTIIYGEEPANDGIEIAGAVDNDAEDFWCYYTYDYTQYDNVGKYTITPSAPAGLDLPNYELVFKPGTLTVEPKEVGFRWGNYENRIYGDGAGEICIDSISYLENDDKISAEITGADLTAGEHTARVTRLIGDKAGNYKLPENPTCTYTVAKAKQTLEFITSTHNITYGSISFENRFTATSDYHTKVMYESSDPNVVTVDNDGNSCVVGAGTATITATAVENENYESVQAVSTVNIAKKPVTISGVSADDKTYDGTETAAFDLTKATIDGIVIHYTGADGVADDLKINAAKAAAAFEDADAGTDKTVTFTGFALTGAVADNYILSEQPDAAKADIARAMITVIPKSGQNKTYGESDPKLDYTSSGKIGDETPAFTGALSRKIGETVGNYAITAGNLALMDNTDSNFKADNYVLELSDNTVNFTINKATPEIKVEDKTLVKNGVAVDITNWASFNNTDTDRKLTYTLVGSPAGITLEDNRLTAENADTTAESFTIRVTADATANFNAPEATAFTVQVVKRADAGVEIEAPARKTYGDADFTLKATTIADDNGTWSWTSSNPDILDIISGADTAAPVIRVWKADAEGATLTAVYLSDTYYGTASVTIKVDPKTITGDMIAEIPAQKYSGSALTPTPYVTDDEIALESGRDFELSYSDNNINVGTATVTITGRGNYTGTVEKKFTIEPKSIEGADIALVSGWFEYNGMEQTVEIKSVTLTDGTVLSEKDYKIKANNKATDAALDIALTIEGTGNYTGTATRLWGIAKIDPELENFEVVPDLSTEQTYSGEAQIVNAATKAGIRGMGAITVKYNSNTEAPTNAGSYDITIEVSEGGNYKAAVIPAGTLTIRKAAAPRLENIEENCQYAKTGEQTVSIADLVPGAKSYTLGEADGSTEIVTNVSVSETGVVKYTLTGTAAAGATVTIPVTITSMNYEDTTVNVVITITKATPTGKPGYNVIHDSSKTLKDAGLDLINSTLDPKEGKLEWIDSEGNVLPDDTKMEEGRKYIWRFTPADPNYEIITGEIELYAPYRILDGADSTWTQDTDGTIAIRGDGEFDKFLNVKVDGVVIDAGNYTAAKGSTIITLKAEYLKTLTEGSHTFEIVWTDGSAGTNFTVAANTSDDDDDSDDNAGNNDTAGSNSASNNNTVPGQITSPKTGDASGIWTTLFMVSIAGFAAMLARRKK